MFTYLSLLPRIWLMSLLVIWALLLFGGFLAGQPDSTRRMPTWTRLTSSFTLVIASWSWYLLAPVALKSLAVWLALGMSLGFVGDLFMAGVGPIPRSVLGGMGAFGLGHISYIVGMRDLASSQHLNQPLNWWVSWGLWLLVGGVGWYIVVFRQQEVGKLHWAALPYALLLASTAGAATALASQALLFIPLAIGAALFLFSDLLIATQLFNQTHFFLIGDVIWLTYGPAQMLIIYSVGAAWQMV